MKKGKMRSVREADIYTQEERIRDLTEQLKTAKIIIGSIAVSGQGYDNWNPALKANVKKFMEL
jgi:hypothetical protein